MEIKYICEECGRIINYEGVQRELLGSRKGGREDSII